MIREPSDSPQIHKNSLTITISVDKCDALRDLVPFVQFKKREKLNACN